MKKNETTSWGKVAGWYDESISSEGNYQKDLILPNLLRLLDIKKDEKILDIACGQGFFACEFFKNGANVYGVDIAPELIDMAKKQSPKDITYYVSGVDNLGMISDNSIDKAVMILAIQNIENVKKMLASCARALKPNGTFFIVMNHPAFRIPRSSSWGWDEQTKTQYRRIDQYLSESRVSIAMHPGSTGSPQAEQYTVSFHRPLQYYSKLLARSGFCIARIEEWESHKQSQPGPRAKAENIARKEFPLFLLLETHKN